MSRGPKQIYRPQANIHVKIQAATFCRKKSANYSIKVGRRRSKTELLPTTTVKSSGVLNYLVTQSSASSWHNTSFHEMQNFMCPSCLSFSQPCLKSRKINKSGAVFLTWPAIYSMEQKHNNAWSENTTKMTKTILIRAVQRTQSEQHFTPPASLR